MPQQHSASWLKITRIVILFFSFLSASTAMAEKNSLCTSNEEAAFSCSLDNGKTVSLCASSDLSNASGYMYYAFGKKGAIELLFPKEKARSRERFLEGATTQGQLDIDYVRFVNGGFGYAVYSATNGASFRKEGVIVEKERGKVISNLACQDSAMGANAWRKVHDAKLSTDQYVGFKLPQVGAVGAVNSIDGFFYGWIGSHGTDHKYQQVAVCFSNLGQSMFFDKTTTTKKK